MVVCSMEMETPTGCWEAAAVKCMPYQNPDDVLAADSEIAALVATQGAKHLMTYLAHIQHVHDDAPYMYIATR